ncbi:hypothetical protein BsWGS_23308 [Bradybaena similaris]
MADAQIGTWRSDPAKTTGYAEFREATGHADKLPAEPEQVTLEISRNGDEWTVTSSKEGQPSHTVTLKEGEKKVTKGLDGAEIELEGHLEGDQWVLSINRGGVAVRSVARVENGELVQEQTINGATVTTRFTRV